MVSVSPQHDQAILLQKDLVFNESKRSQLMFTANPNQRQGLSELTTVDSYKYLGKILDNTLSLASHPNQLRKKLNSSNFVIRRV